MAIFYSRYVKGASVAGAAIALAITVGAMVPNVSNVLGASTVAASAQLADDPNGATVLYNGVVYRAFIDGSADLSRRVVDT